jgi:ATP-binding cassette, subfamily B, multidrug efflux pump
MQQSAREAAPDLEGIEWILKDVSFTIEPGQTVAIVGHTGAGKTTLTSLMMRFYDVTAGQILLDGVDLREQDLTRCASTSPWCCRIRSSSPARWRKHPPRQRRDHRRDLRQAARDVNVLDFIESLPNGFDEPVQERGNSLSTGQKQLINFARALAYNPRILILDEATSSVDTDTELRIRGALERMVEGRTSVLIAHRLSTVQRADTILVMHKGPVARDGLAPATAGAARPLLEALPAAVQGPGNVSFEHIPAMVEAGATMLVGGTSSVFHKDYSIQEAVTAVREILEGLDKAQ